MKEHPILMTTEMVQATLRDIDPKSHTRRLTGLEEINDQLDSPWQLVACEIDQVKGKICAQFDLPKITTCCWCPYGKPGDRLWVREAFYQAGHHAQSHPEDDDWSIWRGLPIYHYVADGMPAVEGENNWNHPLGQAKPETRFIPYKYDNYWRKMPSIHMPRKLSRITLEIQSVRVERLQDITEEDAKAEGAAQNHGVFFHSHFQSEIGNVFRRNYAVLWEKINGPESWLQNPWVWVITFKRLNP